MIEPLAIFKRLRLERCNRGRRRSPVVPMYLWISTLFGSTVAGSMLSDTVGEWVWTLASPIMLLCMPLVLITFVLLRHPIQMLADDKEEKLDERQKSVRYRAYYRSYQIVVSFLFIGLGYAAAAWSYPEVFWSPEGSAAFYVYGAVVWLLVTLPTAIAAWTEPDPAPEIGETR